MIAGFIGGMGTGKTLGLTKYLKMYYDQGKDIYVNYHVNFPHTRISTEMIQEYAKEEKEFSNCVIGIDEMYLYIDSRISSSKANRIYSYFALQTSKRDVIMLYTAQMYHSVDKRIREQTHIIKQCVPVLVIDGKIYPYIEFEKRLVDADVKKYFHVAIISLTRFSFGFSQLTKRVTELIKGSDIFDLYDTREVIAISGKGKGKGKSKK